MEAIITVVGFLGAGKTTLLRTLARNFIDKGWNPYIVLNDYENAHLDVQQLTDQLDAKWVQALSGSCICCSGIDELRYTVNSIPERENGITLIEANGTSDACKLMGFLGVGIEERFLPPVQLSVVDVKNWQMRGEYNDLESNQIQVSSLILLTHVEDVSAERKRLVTQELNRLNPSAEVMDADEIEVSKLSQLSPSQNQAEQLDHLKAHWASCSVDLPDLPDASCIQHICDALPPSILRVKGCTRVGGEESFTYFERTPSGEVSIRPFFGVPTTGPKLLTVGPGSEPDGLKDVINSCISKTPLMG